MRHCSSQLVCLFTVLALFWTNSVMANNETISSVPGLLSSFAGSKILLIGILNSNLTIITKDAPLLVYDVPIVKCTNSKMDLYGLAPMELNSKWPALSNNANFTSNTENTKPLPQSIFTHLDSEDVLVFFFNIHLADVIILESVTFSINSQSASYQEYGIDVDFSYIKSHLLSSTEQNVFFDLVVVPGKSHQLLKYVYQAGNFNHTSSPYMCKQTGTNGTEMIVFMDNFAVCTNLDWDIQNGGFVDQNRFHLFSHDTVYIFEYTGAGADPVGVPLKAVKLSDYFVDAIPSTIPTTVVTSTSKLTTATTLIYRNSTRKAGLSTGTIIIIGIAGAVLAVVLFGIIGACLCCKKAPGPSIIKLNNNSNGKGQTDQSHSQFKQRPSAQANNTSKYSTDSRKLIHKHCKPSFKILTMDSQIGPSEVAACAKWRSLPVPESEARLAEAEAQKKNVSYRRRTISGRHDSRQKDSPKRGSSSKQQQKHRRANQTEKVISSNSFATKHTKAKSKATVVPRHSMSLCGGVKGSNAFKGSNRKF